MRTALLLALLAAACKPQKPAAQPAVAAPAEPNMVVRYAAGLKADVDRAQETKGKADAANKRMEESQKAMQEAEGQ